MKNFLVTVLLCSTLWRSPTLAAAASPAADLGNGVSAPSAADLNFLEVFADDSILAKVLSGDMSLTEAAKKVLAMEEDVEEVLKVAPKALMKVLDENPELWQNSARVVYEAVTKNQVSVPLGNGSIASIVGSVLLSAFFGIALWIAFTAYLKEIQTLKRNDFIQEDSIFSNLANTVRQGIQKHVDKFNLLPKRKHRHPQRPQSQESQQLHTVLHQPQHLQIPQDNKEHDAGPAYTYSPQNPGRVRDATAIRIPVSVLNTRFTDLRNEEDDEDGTGDRIWGPRPVPVPVSYYRPKEPVTEFQPPYTEPPRDFEDQDTPLRPFAQPGRFVNPNRQGPPSDGVTYYFELPPSKRISTIVSRKPSKPLRPQPQTVHTKEDTYYFENPFDSSPGAPRRPVIPVNKPSSFSRRTGTLKHLPTSRPKNDVTYYYEQPPFTLLHPKPNNWKSNADHLVFGTSTSSWNRRKENQRPTTSLPGVEPSSKFSSNHKFFPATITPKPQLMTTTSSEAKEHGVAGNKTTDFEINGGVPVRWIPEEAEETEGDGNAT
ncbi:uncharacterized protein LOC125045092 [Penaeus chinensis]|uniref:uncharacterized protein LOC125045092 n=1 Tax=Penaeus chinensis TaxID=139456 RepID=UPI001FB76CFF|nr:uncharacterized protein LOC125045092 [Penaeus chinensis]